MSLTWKFASFDGEPLVWLRGSAFVRAGSGDWRIPDPSWVKEAKVLSEEGFKARFGELTLPPFPDWMITEASRQTQTPAKHSKT